jgi:hypothetical protein
LFYHLLFLFLAADKSRKDVDDEEKKFKKMVARMQDSANERGKHMGLVLTCRPFKMGLVLRLTPSHLVYLSVEISDRHHNCA